MPVTSDDPIFPPRVIVDGTTVTLIRFEPTIVLTPAQ